MPVVELRAAMEAAAGTAEQGKAYMPSCKPPSARMVAAARAALDLESAQQVAAPVACERKKTTLLNFFKAVPTTEK